MKAIIEELLDLALEAAGDEVQAQIEQAIAENLSLGPEALAYVEEEIDALSEIVGGYYFAFDRGQTAMDRLERGGLDAKASFLACRRYMRLPEIAALDRTIAKLRVVGNVSASIEDAAIMRIAAEIESTRKHTLQSVDDYLYVNGKSKEERANLEEENDWMKQRLLDTSVGYEKSLEKLHKLGFFVERKGKALEERVAELIGLLEHVKEQMLDSDGAFVHFDSHMCSMLEAEYAQ